VEQRLEPCELLGAIEHDRPDATAIDRSFGDHLPTPAVEESGPHVGVAQQLVDDRITGQRRCA
jgi:hypothetical protein